MSSQKLPEPRMRDDFRRELRARLMREAAVVLAPKRRETAWTGRLFPAFSVALAAVVVMIGGGVATAGSGPGDLAFGMRLAIEEARVALTLDDVDRVRVLAEIADERLGELERAADSDDKAPAASAAYAEAITRFRVAVDALQAKAPQGKSDAAQLVVDANRDKHEIVLQNLLNGRLPEKAKLDVERAIERERRDTQNTRRKQEERDEQDREDPEKTQNPTLQGATPRALATPRPTGRSASPSPSRSPTPRATLAPRSTERVETPEPAEKD